jgi:hypothetical protein
MPTPKAAHSVHFPLKSLCPNVLASLSTVPKKGRF